MLRDVDSVHAITCTGFVTEHGFGEQRHGDVVLGRRRTRRPTRHRCHCARRVGVCRRSVQCCELHHLADARPEHVRAINILSDTVFVIVLRSIVVTYHWSDTMHRFVALPTQRRVPEHARRVQLDGYYVSLFGHVHLFYLCPDSDVVPTEGGIDAARRAIPGYNAQSRVHVCHCHRLAPHRRRGYRLYDMHLVDEVTIDLAGDFYIDGHMFTIVDRTRTQRSACYDHRTGRTAYYAGEPQHDAWIMDDDMAVTYRLTEGFCFH